MSGEKEKKRELVFVTYVGAEGRVTVPKGVRDALDIKRRDLVQCTIAKVKNR